MCKMNCASPFANARAFPKWRRCTAQRRIRLCGAYRADAAERRARWSTDHSSTVDKIAHTISGDDYLIMSLAMATTMAMARSFVEAEHERNAPCRSQLDDDAAKVMNAMLSVLACEPKCDPRIERTLAVLCAASQKV